MAKLDVLQVLVVDDNAVKRRTLARVVRRALEHPLGAERPRLVAIGLVGTLAEATSFMDAARVDLVIVDWSFPPAPGDSEVRGAGRAVVERCRREGRPFLVASSEDPEPDLVDLWLPTWDPEALRRKLAALFPSG